jgi:hypothetical protein
MFSMFPIEQGRYGRLARTAALFFLSEQLETEPEENNRLLSDIRDIIQLKQYDKYISTDSLLSELFKIQEAPWKDLGYGRQLEARGLAKRLSPYGIRPKKIRVGESTPKGYDVDGFRDAFKRYLPPDTYPVEIGTTGTKGTTDQVMKARQLRKLYKDYAEGKEHPEGKDWNELMPEFAKIPEDERRTINHKSFF